MSLLQGRRWSRGHAATAACILLILYAALAFTAASRKSNTFDEIVYVTGGYSYWLTGDYRIHPENGPLPQRWMALPLLLLTREVRFPSTNGPDWWNSELWSIAYRFFYGMGNDAVRMLMLARSMTILLGVALGAAIYLLSLRIYGHAGGLLSVALFSFCPNMLAYGAQATSDLAAALFLLLAVTAVWSLLLSPTWPRAALAAVAVAVMFLTKMSAVVLVPVTLVLILIRVRDLRRFVLPLAGALVMVFALIWALYGFRYSAFSTGAVPGRDRLFIDRSADVSASGGTVPDRAIRFLRAHRVLPEAFLSGALTILRNTAGRRAFLNGEYSVTGWKRFFPYSFLVKTPLGLLALLLLAALVAKPPWGRLVPYLVLCGVYWLFLIFSKVDIGHRYLLPAYPPLFILAGAAWKWGETAAARRAMVAALVAAFMLESILVYPDYLAFFNPIAGGPKHAYRHLVDSSLDGGQDLPALKRWLDRNAPHGSSNIYLSYFGTSSPEYYGIRSIRLPGNAAPPPPRAAFQLTEGIYCISATMLQSVYSPAMGPWNVKYEAWYRKVAAERKNFDLYNKLRLARLCAYLRHREPDDAAGYSILIYRLSRADVERAIQGPPPELLPDIAVQGLEK